MKKLRTWDEALPKTGVTVVLGYRGGGKSALTWWLADQAHQQGRKVACLGLPKKARRHFPKWVKHLTDYEDLQRHKGLLVIVDEAKFQASARRHQSEENVAWTRMVAVCRQAHHLLLFGLQANRGLDVDLVSEADLVCFKRPSILHVRFSRPELREEVETARMKLERKGPGWTFVKEFRDGAWGLLENPLPSWWSEAASEAFALVALENGNGTTKGASHAGKRRLA